ncbi:mCG114044 [Mus musculus]|nr:mCG114044 [Mus musculus]
MAGELSQEALLDFLCQAGGRVRNAELLSHFKSFLRDPHVSPGQLQERRERFKGFVNSVAAVRQDPDGTKYVVLKRRYRDLLGEEGLQRPGPVDGKPRGHRRRDPEPQKPPAGAGTQVDVGGSAQKVAGPDPSPEDSPNQRTPEPEAAQARGRCAAVGTRGRCCWECQQNGWGQSTGQPLPEDLGDPAVACEKPERAAPARDDLGAPGPSEHRSPLVPLDTREHEWIVRLASGSWLHVLTLFWEDPQLALHRDFLTGYTALHWIAKHGDLCALQDLVSGAQKAGIALDVNVRSSCGYTPLHLAAIHGHQGVIKLLVQRLASRVNIRDCSGKKPWQYLNSNVSGETWQLLGAPRGKPIFPVYSLVQSSSPARKVKSREVSRNVTRKTSLAALLKTQHNKWKLASQYEKIHTSKEREEYSD